MIVLLLKFGLLSMLCQFFCFMLVVFLEYCRNICRLYLLQIIIIPAIFNKVTARTRNICDNGIEAGSVLYGKQLLCYNRIVDTFLTPNNNATTGSVFWNFNKD